MIIPQLELGPPVVYLEGHVILKMAESETGLTDLMHDLDLEDVNDTGHERNINVKIINGFYYQNVDFMTMKC